MKSYHRNQAATAKNWYQEPMVWMLIAIPLSAVVVGVVMLTFSIRSYDGLVVDDYYKHGKEINRVLTRNSYAKEYGMRAEVKISLDQKVQVSLAHNQDYSAPGEMTMRLLHRTRAGLDQEIQLIQSENGYYQGQFAESVDGLWTAQLETEEWRIVSDVNLPSASFLLSAL